MCMKVCVFLSTQFNVSCQVYDKSCLSFERFSTHVWYMWMTPIHLYWHASFIRVTSIMHIRYALYKTQLGKSMHDQTCAACANLPPHSSSVAPQKSPKSQQTKSRYARVDTAGPYVSNIVNTYVHVRIPKYANYAYRFWFSLVAGYHVFRLFAFMYLLIHIHACQYTSINMRKSKISYLHSQYL